MLFWILLLALVSLAYALLIIWALPKLILKSKYPIAKTTDRGIKKYKFSDSDYAIVYEPSLSVRKYITQYILAKRDGKKTFQGKIAPNVTYIDFDLALRDPERTDYFLPEYDSGDHLHPSAAGYRKMAQMIPTEILK